MFKTCFTNNTSLGIKKDLMRGTEILLKVIKEKILTENYFLHVIS